MFNSDVCLTASICLETLVIDSDPGPVPGGSCCQCQLKFQFYKLSLPCVADQLVDDQAVLLNITLTSHTMHLQVCEQARLHCDCH